MITSRAVFTDEHGRKYREIYEWDSEGRLECKGRLMEEVPDSRQQPKSLAYRLIEERNRRANEEK